MDRDFHFPGLSIGIPGFDQIISSKHNKTLHTKNPPYGRSLAGVGGEKLFLLPKAMSMRGFACAQIAIGLGKEDTSSTSRELP